MDDAIFEARREALEARMERLRIALATLAHDRRAASTDELRQLAAMFNR
jgi:hypothetical protein